MHAELICALFHETFSENYNKYSENKCSEIEHGGDKLKFLIKVVPMGISPMPPEQSTQLLMAEMEYWHKLEKTGKIVGGPFAGKQGGGGIIEVESLDELHSMLTGAPFYGMACTEVHALTTFEASKKAVNQQLEALKKR